MQSQCRTIPGLARPVTLEEGKQYWLRCPAKNQGKFNLMPVRFISYTACPAIVVITDNAGRTLRSSRDDILTQILAESPFATDLPHATAQP
jgi:hypothetical protein